MTQIYDYNFYQPLLIRFLWIHLIKLNHSFSVKGDCLLFFSGQEYLRVGIGQQFWVSIYSVNVYRMF